MSEAEGVVALVREAQRQGERILRLEELASTPITSGQYRVLDEHSDRLPDASLTLSMDLTGAHLLTAGNRVGSSRFVAADGTEVLVLVEPKVDSADVFRMLDRTTGRTPDGSERTEIAVARAPVTAIFLRHFGRQLRDFLDDNPYRSYRFVEEHDSTRVKGRPLLRQYGLRNVPRGRSHILPSRHLDLSRDVPENQVLAYSVLVAVRLLRLLDLEHDAELRGLLQECARLLTGVEPRRSTPEQLARSTRRLGRAARRFEDIHRLCRVLLENETLALAAGDHIPYAAFTLDMPRLFERYVQAVLSAALGASFIGDKRRLVFPTDTGRSIELDGLIVDGSRRVVVEAKYRDLDMLEDDLVLGVVPERHVYQTVAYASHELVRAGEAVIVYPTWSPDGPPVRVSPAVADYGWWSGRKRHLDLRLLGIDLAAPFPSLAAGARQALARA